MSETDWKEKFVDARNDGQRRFGARTLEAKEQIAAAREAATIFANCVRGQDRGCVLPNGHIDLCQRDNGEVILVKRESYKREPGSDSARWAAAIDAKLAETNRHQVHGAQVPDVGPVTPAGKLDQVLEAVALDPTEEAARRLRPYPGMNAAFPVHEGRPEPDPATVLSGDDANVLNAFGEVCRALEEHAEKGKALQAAYLKALESVSRMAARRNRGR